MQDCSLERCSPTSGDPLVQLSAACVRVCVCGWPQPSTPQFSAAHGHGLSLPHHNHKWNLTPWGRCPACSSECSLGVVHLYWWPNTHRHAPAPSRRPTSAPHLTLTGEEAAGQGKRNQMSATINGGWSWVEESRRRRSMDFLPRGSSLSVRTARPGEANLGGT